MSLNGSRCSQVWSVGQGDRDSSDRLIPEGFFKDSDMSNGGILISLGRSESQSIKDCSTLRIFITMSFAVVICIVDP